MSAPATVGGISEARKALRDAAFAFVALADDKGAAEASRELEAAARAFAGAVESAASGVTAAKSQAARDEKRGVRLCPSCTVPIAPAAGADGGPMQWIDARTYKPHRCGR